MNYKLLHNILITVFTLYTTIISIVNGRLEEKITAGLFALSRIVYLINEIANYKNY